MSGMGSMAASAEQLAEVLGLVTHATQRLLGDTITIGEQAWRAPSRLPGWSRGHVATHIARQADALVRVAGGALNRERVPMYTSPAQRTADIEAGAGRSALDLQIDLDTSAEHLTEAFDALEAAGAWPVIVDLRGMEVPARLLPLARLSEVVLHHIDLDAGFGVDDVDEVTATWLLQWCAVRVAGRHDHAAVRLITESGFAVTVGSPEAAVPVEGSAAHLLAWLTGRGPAGSVTGADGLHLPPY